LYSFRLKIWRKNYKNTPRIAAGSTDLECNLTIHTILRKEKYYQLMLVDSVAR